MKTAAPAMGIAVSLAGLMWLVVLLFVPPVDSMGAPVDRLIFALKCACVAMSLTFLTGVEAVSHERLISKAFDPLAGQDSNRLKVNNRYLQNTLEQLLLFVPGLLALAVYCDSGSSMRAVIATTLVWTLARITFWIGYHIAPQHRVAGLVGALQSMIVLLYVSTRFGYEVAGPFGGALPLILFAGAEIIITIAVSRP
jgi:MAPEG family